MSKTVINIRVFVLLVQTDDLSSYVPKSAISSKKEGHIDRGDDLQSRFVDVSMLGQFDTRKVPAGSAVFASVGSRMRGIAINHSYTEYPAKCYCRRFVVALAHQQKTASGLGQLQLDVRLRSSHNGGLALAAVTLIETICSSPTQKVLSPTAELQLDREATINNNTGVC